MKAVRILFSLLTVLFVVGVLTSSLEIKAGATTNDQTNSKEFVFYFQHDSYILDLEYRSNASHLLKLEDFLSNVAQIDSISVIASASPEGIYEHNLKLSKERAKSIKSMIVTISHQRVQEDEVQLHPIGEDWPRFQEFVEQYYYNSDRNKVLNILKSNIKNDTKKWRLKQLNGGKTYQNLIYNYAYRFRTASSVIVYYHKSDYNEVLFAQNDTNPNKSDDPDSQISDTEEIPNAELAPNDELSRNSADDQPSEDTQAETSEADDIADAITSELENSIKAPKLRTIIAAKTNLLFDLATILNYAIEIPIGDRLSLIAQSNNPWWMTKDREICNQMFTLGAEARIWLGNRENRDRLTGHSIGIHGFSGYGDWRWHRDICYQARFASAGLSYAYSSPIGKWANLELSIAAGWARINYDHYMPSEDFKLLYRDYNDWGSMNYFGPTKIEVSIVIPIRAIIGGRSR